MFMSTGCEVKSLLVLPIVITPAEDGTVELVRADELAITEVVSACCNAQGDGVLRGGTRGDHTEHSHFNAGCEQGKGHHSDATVGRR